MGVFIFFVTGLVSAEENTSSVCDDIIFSIVGPNALTIGSLYNYDLSISFLDGSDVAILVPQDILSQATLQYELLQANKVLQRGNDLSEISAFGQIGSYTLRATITYQGCRYALEKDISLYNAIYIYIGQYMDDFNFGIIQNIIQNDILLHTIIVTEEQLSNPILLLQTIRQQYSYFRYANDIYFSLKNYSLVFDIVRLLESDPTTQIADKNIFVVDDVNKVIATKFLARFMQTVSLQSIYIISTVELIDIFLQLSIGKDPYGTAFLDQSAVQFIKTSSYRLSYVIDYLLFQGFPLNMLVLILSCVFAVLFIVFCKQVIGIPSYGVYPPLLFAISLNVVGIKLSLFLLFVACFSKVCVTLFIRRLPLLATAKLGLQIVLYIFFTIFALVLLKSLGIIHTDFSIFTNTMMLLSYFSLVLIASKIWTSSGILIGWRQILSVVGFLLLSFVAYFIIESDSLHYIIMLHPWIVVLALCMIIFLGRYTGLQLIEYIRFWPLIRYLQGKK